MVNTTQEFGICYQILQRIRNAKVILFWLILPIACSFEANQWKPTDPIATQSFPYFLSMSIPTSMVLRVL